MYDSSASVRGLLIIRVRYTHPSHHSSLALTLGFPQGDEPLTSTVTSSSERGQRGHIRVLVSGLVIIRGTQAGVDFLVINKYSRTKALLSEIEISALEKRGKGDI